MERRRWCVLIDIIKVQLSAEVQWSAREPYVSHKRSCQLQIYIHIYVYFKLRKLKVIDRFIYPLESNFSYRWIFFKYDSNSKTPMGCYQPHVLPSMKKNDNILTNSATHHKNPWQGYESYDKDVMPIEKPPYYFCSFDLFHFSILSYRTYTNDRGDGRAIEKCDSREYPVAGPQTSNLIIIRIWIEQSACFEMRNVANRKWT